jgi:hypothetical protein
MGFPPPPDLPLPDVQDAELLNASFTLGLPVASLCGFALPSILLGLGIVLPSPLPIPPPLPKFKLAIGLNCSLDNPLDVSAGIEFGGGRVATGDPDPDLQY